MIAQRTAQAVRIAWSEPGQPTGATVASLPLTIGRDTTHNTIVFDSRFVSGQHTRLERQGQQLIVTDLGSKNGTYVNGQRISEPTALAPGGSFQIGTILFTVEPESFTVPVVPDAPTAQPGTTSVATNVAGDSVLTFNAQADRLTAAPNTEDPLPALFRQQVVPAQELGRFAPVETATYLAVGGGMGSFAWVDQLVIRGVDPGAIIVVGFEPKPHGRFERLAGNSQITAGERLRSNSDSCPDNIWGWPGYAVREMWRDFWRGRWANVARVGWQIFNEPFVPTYTPLADEVFASVEREARRVGWDGMWRQGRVRTIRQTDDGRYAALYSRMIPGGGSAYEVVVADYLHVAVGYPGVRFLPDLQAYRQATQDFRRVVNAYEQHDYLYDELAQRGGVVMIRGRGIVASRVIQRVHDLRRDTGAQIGVLHLMRTPRKAGSRYKLAQRPVRDHWEFQPFNWPKAAWGGDLRGTLLEADDGRRAEILDMWDGSTTADREDWRVMIDEGLRDGWYEIQFGDVLDVSPHESGRIATVIRSKSQIERDITLLADFIIDATGLVSDISSSPLLHDLASCYGLNLNAKGRLAVSPDFELEGLRSDTGGSAYGAGIMLLGGPYAPVDSFLGLQYAALRSVDHLTRQGAAGLRRFGLLRSVGQWLRWATGVKPS